MNRIGGHWKALALSATAGLLLIGCGGDSGTEPPINVVETYAVLSDSVWNVVESSAGAPSGYVVFRKSDTGVSFGSWQAAGSQLLGITTNVGNTGENEKWLLKLPPVDGATWSVSGTSDGSVITSTTVLNEISLPVTVAAGTFLCVQTTEVIAFPQGYNKNAFSEHKRYFAPGVGLVKVAARTVGGKLLTGELQSFSVSGSDSTDYFPLKDNDSWTFKWTSG